MTESDIFFGSSGPRDSPIAIVGESWGSEEAAARAPFVGSSGLELRRMLTEAGIDPTSCFMTNVFAVQPRGNDAATLFETNQEAKSKGLVPCRGLHLQSTYQSSIPRLHEQLRSVQPKVVVAAGNYALWALTKCASASSISMGNGATVLVPSGIMSWRGSMLYSDEIPGLSNQKVLPIIHPAAILRAWYQRAVTLHDLSERIPQALANDWRRDDIIIEAPPTYDRAIEVLKTWLELLEHSSIRLVCDIETYKRSIITCIGLAASEQYAIVIPFVRQNDDKSLDSYWPIEQEAELLRLIRKIFHHPNVLLEGQNFLYDTQYIHRWFGTVPRCDFDTMLAHHLLFPGTPKGLDYLSSLYCKYHWYWKDDGKEWDARHQGLAQLLQYNGVDCIRTYECGTVLRDQIEKHGFTEQWKWVKRKRDLALRMMMRGIRIDTKRRAQMGFDLMLAQQNIHRQLEEIAPRDIMWGTLKSRTDKAWYASARQTLSFFTDVLGLPVQRNHKTGNPSVDDAALNYLAGKAPEWKKMFNLLSDERSVDVFMSTFVRAELEDNNRMICSFNPAGTDTLRWSSSANAFGRGTNLQNVPSGTEE